MNPSSSLPLAVCLPEYHATPNWELFIYALCTTFFVLYRGSREVLIRKVKGVNIVPLWRCMCRAIRLRESSIFWISARRWQCDWLPRQVNVHKHEGTMNGLLFWKSHVHLPRHRLYPSQSVSRSVLDYVNSWSNSRWLFIFPRSQREKVSGNGKVPSVFPVPSIGVEKRIIVSSFISINVKS